MTTSLDLVIENKEGATILFPTINFLDAQSLNTWLEMRRVALSVGSRYTIRLYYLTITFLIVVGVFTLGLILAVAGDSEIDYDLPRGQLVQLGFIFAFLIYYTIQIVMPVSHINQMTVEQIKKFILIREVLLRLVTQPEWLKKPRGTVYNRYQQVAMMILHNETKDLKGDERFEKKEELATKMYERIGDAIGMLEQEL